MLPGAVELVGIRGRLAMSGLEVGVIVWFGPTFFIAGTVSKRCA